MNVIIRAMGFALAAGLAACGGQFEGAGGDAGADAAPVDGSAGDSGSPSCPVAPPSGACAREGLVCEYGNDPNGCNDLYQCERGGNGTVWVDTTAGAGACAQRPDGGACPATYASIAEGAACEPQGWQCPYAEGTCICADKYGGLQPAPGTPPHWTCSHLSPGCPTTRPRYGTACSTEGMSCDYGACFGGTMAACTGGVWQPGAFGCPAAANGG